MLFSVEQLLELPEKPDLVCVKQDDTIRVAVKQMIENDFSQLPVVDRDHNLVGLISERSIVRTYLVNDLPCEQLLPSNMSSCPQS